MLSTESVTYIGLAAGCLTTISFLPQAIKVWKLKETRDLSLLTFLVLLLGIILWFIYGLLIKDIPVILANGITMLFVASIVFFKLKFG